MLAGSSQVCDGPFLYTGTTFASLQSFGSSSESIDF